jgi:hypothetical protein
MPFEQKYGSCGNAGKKSEKLLARIVSVDILICRPRCGADGKDENIVKSRGYFF